MYWSAKNCGRVIVKARNISFGYVLAALLVFVFDQTSSISPHSDEKDSGLATLSLVENGSAGVDANSDHADFASYTFHSQGHSDAIIAAGEIVQTMDEDSFLGRISSEKFWRRKRKKKSSGASAAQIKKQRAEEIEAAPRSGLLNAKPGGSLFDLFSNSQPLVLPPKPKELADNVGMVPGGYRTLCVRLNDGYYWPVSFATKRDRFLKDQLICKRSCAEPVRLFVYKNPDGRPEDMVDLRGRRYADLENAWRYREEYIAERKCGPHPWEEAAIAKHKAYALMAKRGGGAVTEDAGLKGKRRLVRVGRVRTMSTIDLEYIGNTRFKIDETPLNVPSPQRVSGGKKENPEGGPGNQKLTAKIDRSRAMRLGVGDRKSARKRKAKPYRYRSKPKRQPRWAREAFGFD